MNKKEMIREIADRLDYTYVDVGNVINEFINIVTEKLIEGDDVKIRGLGTWKTKIAGAKVLKLPNGKKRSFRPYNKVLHTVSELLKDKVRGK